MRVTVKNLTTGAKFVADIVEGSLAHHKVDLGNGRLFVGGSDKYWLDANSDQGFRYKITEHEDSKSYELALDLSKELSPKVPGKPD